MFEKCKNCLYGKRLISENGYFYTCSLSDKKAINCMLRIKSYYIKAFYKFKNK